MSDFIDLPNGTTARRLAVVWATPHKGNEFTKPAIVINFGGSTVECECESYEEATALALRIRAELHEGNAPTKDEFEYDWTGIDHGYVWSATDSDGEEWAFDGIPTRLANGTWATTDGSSVKLRSGEAPCPNFRNSLRYRGDK